MGPNQKRFKSIDGFVSGPSSRPKSISTPAPKIDLARLESRPKVEPARVVPREEVKLEAAVHHNPPQFVPKELRPHKLRKKRWTVKRKLVTACLSILIVGFGIGTWYGTKIIGSIDKVFHGNVISDAQALYSNTTINGESSGRVNILLAGDSADDPNHAGADLTDSIMVVSIDLKTHNGFMLSIPRDLWVDIPGEGHQKINAANDVTNFSQNGYPSGGMGQLQEIVQTDLGIPIDYYSLIDYTAFRDAVNAVNGVTVNIQSPDPRGVYDPTLIPHLPNGEDSLNGQTALGLARSRGDQYGSYGFPDSDFDRTMYQREMLTAVAQKATTLGVIANPLKISSLFAAFGNNVQTNLNIQDLLTLIRLTKGTSVSSLKSLSYSYGGTNPLLKGYVDPSSGEDSLIPAEGLDDYSQLQQYYQQLTSSNPIVREAPSVFILNGSSVDGLAQKEELKLEAEGFNVLGIADANQDYPGTMVVNNVTNTKPGSLSLLQKTFPGTTVSSTTGSAEAGEATNYTSDFVVILGQNWDSSVKQTN